MPIKNSKIHKSVSIINKDLVNIYGYEIYENTKIGPFVEIQKDVVIGKNCKIIPVEYADQVLKVTLTKELKRTEWVEVDISKKEDKSQARIQ